MRALFTTTPGLGHFHPLVPLARALESAGHEVAFAGLEGVRRLAENAGFRFFSAERGVPVAERELHLPERMPGLGLENELHLHAKMFCGLLPSLMAAGLVDIGRTWRPDVFIRESAEYAAVIAAEHLGIPHAAVSCFATIAGPAIFERGLAAEIGPACAEVNGLGGDRVAALLHRYLNLTQAPPSLALHPLDGACLAPRTTHFIRPRFFDASGVRQRQSPLPMECGNWRCRTPQIHVTLGSEANGLPEVYPGVLQTILDGLGGEPLSVIVTLGFGGDPEDFHGVAPNVQLHRYIPQSELLPHCDAAVMHGGSNSLLALIDAGLPFVIVPLIADQFFNARAAQDLGLGRVIQPAALSPETVREAAADVLSHPAYRANVRRLRDEMHALPDLGAAVELVQKLARDRAPLPNPDLPA